MTTQELQTLIAGDSEAAALFAAGNDSGCAERCREIAPPVRCVVPARDVKRKAISQHVWSGVVLSAENPQETLTVRSLCISVRDWMSDTTGTIDMDLPVVQEMLAGLVAVGKLTQAQADEIDAMADCPQTITVDEVSACRQ